MLVAERRGHVLVATLARPPVNAIDAALLGRLEAIVAQAETDESISLLHLRSAQRVFCAGADLGLMRACFAEGAPERMVALVRGMQQVFTRIERAPFATLAEIGGAALGGGLELALACDLRVAAHEAQLGLPEIGLGLLPAAGGTQRLTSLCGPGVARRLILGGETVDGGQARELGLVHWALPTEALADFAAALAQRVAAHPRDAIAANKRCITIATAAAKSGFAAEIDETRLLYAAASTQERVAAFLDRPRRAASA